MFSNMGDYIDIFFKVKYMLLFLFVMVIKKRYLMFSVFSYILEVVYWFFKCVILVDILYDLESY